MQKCRVVGMERIGIFFDGPEGQSQVVIVSISQILRVRSQLSLQFYKIALGKVSWSTKNETIRCSQ